MQVCLQTFEVSRQQDALLVPDYAVRGGMARGVAWLLPLFLAGDGWSHGREDGESAFMTRDWG